MKLKNSVTAKSDLLVFNIILSIVLLFFIIVGFNLFIKDNFIGGLIIILIFSILLITVCKNIYGIKIIQINKNEIIVYSFWSNKTIYKLTLNEIDRIVIKYKSDVKLTTKYLKITSSNGNFKINIVGLLLSDILPYFINNKIHVFEELGDGSLRLIKK